MGKKLEQANENIEILIGELVSEKVSNLGITCPYYMEKVRPCKKNNSDCSLCSEQWEKILERN